MPDLAEALAALTGESFDYFMDYFGKCFVRFFTNFGYDKMLKATGRYFCDFLQSVDNIHLQMRFNYPKMKSPSMQLTETDDNGAVLVESFPYGYPLSSVVNVSFVGVQKQPNGFLQIFHGFTLRNCINVLRFG